jgi:nucleoporin NUP42
MSSVQPCRFFQQGRCQFGADCRNSHGNIPTKGNPGATAATFRQVASSFTPFISTSQLNHSSPPCSREGIKLDLTTERPYYVLSSYGPGKNEPSLIKGQDLSPEELRLQFYKARAANNPALYVCRYLYFHDKGCVLS